MKLLLALLLIVGITSCATHNNTPKRCDVPNITAAPSPPKIASYCKNKICDYNKYATDLNWYMLYIFTYTKTVNEYADARGWKKPKGMPICRLVPWPIPDKFPEFSSTKTNVGVVDFEWELTQYIKKLRKIHSQHNKDLIHSIALQRSLCTY